MPAAWRRLFVVVSISLAVAACRGGGPPRARGDAGAAAAAATAEAALAREASVAIDFRTHTATRIDARPGARVPVDGMWSRYARYLGAPPASLAEDGPPQPSAARPGTTTWYQQVHRGYPVAGYGYHVEAEQGFLRSAYGRVMPGLPASLPAPMPRDQALESAVRRLGLRAPLPWVAEPARHHAPDARLQLWSGKALPAGGDFVLVWRFDFTGTGASASAGVPGTATVIVDAKSGAVLVPDPDAIR